MWETSGFLTEVNLKDYTIAMDDLLRGSYKIEERMLLEMVIQRGKRVIEDNNGAFTALNEFTLTRNMMSKIIDLEVIVNGLRYHQLQGRRYNNSHAHRFNRVLPFSWRTDCRTNE